MEQLDLTVPIAGPTISTYKIIELRMNWPNGEIDVTLADELGKTIFCQYRGAEAIALMLVLNTANLSVKSLHKRTMEKLQADGKLPTGTISGTP